MQKQTNTRKKFKIGDRVKIIKTSEYYREGDSSNPIDTVGEVIRYKKTGMPIEVRWSSDFTVNSYEEHDLVLASSEPTVDVSREFVLRAYDSACSDWKRKIESEIPNLFALTHQVRASFIRDAYKAADTSWKKNLKQAFPELFKDAYTCLVPGVKPEDLNASLYTQIDTDDYRRIEGVSLMDGIAGKFSVPKEAKGCGFYIDKCFLEDKTLILKTLSTGSKVIYFKNRKTNKQ
jgi:hypothetical protein